MPEVTSALIRKLMPLADERRGVEESRRRLHRQVADFGRVESRVVRSSVPLARARPTQRTARAVERTTEQDARRPRASAG